MRIGDLEVGPGRKGRVELPVARVFTGTQLSLPVVVVHGRRPGKKLWLDAAIHGDELNGIRIIREVLRILDPRRLRGVVVAAPVVNVFGLIHNSRYLPDRRDLNRCFPGSRRGSLASRLARLFVDEVVKKCEIG
ncbi:MAG: succinylglutamate desuccinylase/aspartoacylase family protein, partial [Thermoanaerobaculia bacterium]|nr:succinylglutamate desuccinylase/aspartoacylase family protein [Thermoanaerobaculia bacterium]